jgi:hypothetical protein
MPDAAVTHPPACPSTSPCDGASAECRDGCAVTCLEGAPEALHYECSAVGTCIVESTAAGEIARCDGGGWFDECDATYEARCDGNIAFDCDESLGVVHLHYCSADALCWADGPDAGCAPEADSCGERGARCGGGPSSAPCCDGLLCSNGACSSAEGAECRDQYECDSGLACRTADGEQADGEPGRCVVPECWSPGTLFPSDGEDCTWRDLPCCGLADAVCGDGGVCCFPAGVVPLVDGHVTPRMCCSGGTNVDDTCTAE